MSGPAGVFREIHRLRRHARDLQEQVENLPRQLNVRHGKQARAEGALRDAQEAIKRLKVDAHAKEVTLKTRHEHIAKYQKQLNEVTSKKEYDALQLEIAHAKDECRRLEDEILSALSEGEERAARLPELEQAVAQAKKEVAGFEEDAKAKRADLEAQLAQVQERLKAAEVNVPAGLRDQYHRIVNAKGADGFAAVRERTCTACNTEITVQMYHDLRQEMFLVCRSCGRILYLPEPVQADEDEG
jgi:predicted  nucleic acid-binding Zn-ribbon protein